MGALLKQGIHIKESLYINHFVPAVITTTFVVLAQTAAKTYTAAIAAARQIARDQRRASVSISPANCAPCREPGANANFLYRDFDVSKR
jgi:hypothetical protein